ncbi:TetR/AcrR family transcriptional regulator [Caldisalinibacter kiritimatiensis]|uniref:HTH tetR-type domain-containing protein n=1 Tax=Caldisalinibacter kiritimatiensis TaxID=1304284 RepID=R1AS12_9FIRM|nr:TetR/AcrR family transcriptional regulator [Caldisalinibacter kiritimatiensis]EOC99927.1 hypothetical protein L21TH_2038 [Caldisalinibacter kiritimatiensis]
MPKIVDYEERKREIAKVAKEVFLKKGYHKTKLSDISMECGIGRTTLYQYFKNKDDIFYFTMHQAIDELKKNLKNIINAQEKSFLEKIKLIILELIREYENNNMIVILTELWLILRRERIEVIEKIKERAIELRKVFEYLLKEGIKAKEIKPIDIKSMSNTLYALVESLVIQLSLHKEINIQQQFKSIDILIDGLKI